MEAGADPRELWPDVVERNQRSVGEWLSDEGGERYERHRRTGAAAPPSRRCGCRRCRSWCCRPRSSLITLAADAIARRERPRAGPARDRCRRRADAGGRPAACRRAAAPVPRARSPSCSWPTPRRRRAPRRAAGRSRSPPRTATDGRDAAAAAHLDTGRRRMSSAEIGVFGGSGFYSFLDDAEEVAVDTPVRPHLRPLRDRRRGRQAGRVHAPPRPHPQPAAARDPLPRQPVGDEGAGRAPRDRPLRVGQPVQGSAAGHVRRLRPVRRSHQRPRATPSTTAR